MHFFLNFNFKEYKCMSKMQLRKFVNTIYTAMKNNIVLHFKHCNTLKCIFFIPALARDIISDKTYVN